MKKVLATLACTLFAFTATANANPYYDGYADGQQSADDLWNTVFGADCYSFFEFAEEAEQTLIKGKYKKKKGDNWYVKTWKKGGKQGTKDYAADIEEECLTPGYCDGMGEAAATEIIAEFCLMRGGNKHTITEMCREHAIDTCKGTMYSELEKWLDLGLPCSPINDDIEEITFTDLYNMKKQCPDKVDEMIEG